MKIEKSILTKNRCYTAGRKITVKGLMLHSVGVGQPKADVFISSWNNAEMSVCVHAFIDGNDGTVYQTLPWNHRGWHCGSGSKGSGNNTHIGVEMCEPAQIRYTGGSSFTVSSLSAARACAKRTYEAAVELFAYLCGEYGLDPSADGVVISHKEGNARGIASNHGDPEHLWNGLGLPYTMDSFRAAVKAKMADGSSIGTSGKGGESGESSDGDPETSASNVPAVPFLVRVKIPNLYIRKNHTVDAATNGYTGKGTFTVTATKRGKVKADGTKGTWGKLKSGAGWICLAFDEYTEIV